MELAAELRGLDGICSNIPGCLIYIRRVGLEREGVCVHRLEWRQLTTTAWFVSRFIFVGGLYFPRL